MANEKEYNRRDLISIENESPTHKKKSETSSKSASIKRSNHKHDYEKVIIESGLSAPKYYWGKRCRICGRVDDSGMFKEGATEGLVKKVEKVQVQEDRYSFKIFYPLRELKTLFPDTTILEYNSRKYEEMKE